ncbi:MAG: hypothetical protein GY711_04280, partial [bacterium]|nr:hypothetical protein [bacterium]
MKSSIRVTHVRLLLAVSLASSAAAQGLGPEVLYTNLAGHPTAAVPGLPAGVEFFSGGQKAFNRPYVSPNGHWVMWSTTSINNARGIILRDGEVILHQGQPVPGHPAETLNCFNDICVEKLGVNDAGFVAGSFHFAGNPNDDLRVMRHDPGTMTWSEIAREVGPANLNVPGSFTWGHLLRNASIDAAGDVAFEASLTVGAVLLMLGADPLFQMGTPPSNLPAFPVDSIPAYIDDGYWIDASGSSWLARAVLAGTPADDVVVVDGAVVLREGFAVPGSGMAAIASGGLFLSEMDAGGNWYAGGLNVDGTEWIVRNGVVIAATGQTVAGGAEVWAQAPNLPSFFVHTGNAAGDWVVGGYTSAQRYALAVNAARVVWRQGDPIDLDADGSYDDGL